MQDYSKIERPVKRICRNSERNESAALSPPGYLATSAFSSKLPSTHPNCQCGRPDDKEGGKHTCRMFGKFRCSRCKNEWSSAYCWYTPETDAYEEQNCRRCDSPGECIDARPRERRGSLGENINGAHECDLCSRCLRLGRDCSGGRG